MSPTVAATSPPPATPRSSANKAHHHQDDSDSSDSDGEGGNVAAAPAPYINAMRRTEAAAANRAQVPRRASALPQCAAAARNGYATLRCLDALGFS